jgi:putative hydrolase of the HAD superfamily
MIKAIIFDWGGVLIDNPAREMHKYYADVLGVEVDEYCAVAHKYNDDFTRGLIKESDMWQQICSELGVSEPESKSLWGDGVNNVFNKKHEMFELIDDLKNRGYKIGFLSNTEMPAVEYWKRNNYQKYFDEAVFSCLEHMAKPDAEIYHLICERLEVLPEETVFIDDKLEFVEGAKNIGMEGIVFENCEQTKKDLQEMLKA